jgi:Domain of unknown function (DUF3854)
VNPALTFLLCSLYGGHLHPAHLADLRKSGLSDTTIRLQRIRSVPPAMIDPLLGFDATKVRHAYVIPFPDPRGGWFDHVRMRAFPNTEDGAKYLQPRRSGVRIFFPVATLPAVLHSTGPLYLVEGEKKSLSVAQLGLPAIGICGIEGWHYGGSRDLHANLDGVDLRSREVNVLADGDWLANPAVNRAVQNLVAALERRGARPEIVNLVAEAA